MKRRYPKNIIQALVLLFVPLLFISPLLLFSKFLVHSEAELFGLYALLIICFSFLINRRRRKYLPKKIIKSKENKILLYLTFVLLFYLVGVAPIISEININSFFVENRSTLSFENIDFIKAISIVIIAPILEELLFRNIILKGFLDNYKSNVKAVVYSSLIFAAFHLMPDQIINAFFLGLLLGTLFYATNNIVYAVIFHSITNILDLSITSFNNVCSLSIKVLFFIVSLAAIALLSFYVSKIIKQTT